MDKLLTSRKSGYANILSIKNTNKKGKYIMKVKSFSAVLLSIMLMVLMLSTATYASTSVTYANRFESWKDHNYFKCQYQFIPAHVGTANDPYCDEGKQVKRAYVTAYRDAGSVAGITSWEYYTTGRKYSPIATSRSDTTTYKTSVASIEDLLFPVEHTTYNFFNF